jgi:NAD(P)-dependent dehydrogenase (short-subunit alcohol dehydrogenase family)
LQAALTGNIFWACKYGFPHLIATGGGSVVNISSDQSLIGISGFSAYAASKGAMNSVTRNLAVENAKYNIRVNAILVGRVVTNPKDTSSKPSRGHLTRLGTPDDIAYCATWLASNEAGFVTGALVPVDGGLTINGDALVGI